MYVLNDVAKKIYNISSQILERIITLTGKVQLHVSDMLSAWEKVCQAGVATVAD